ncbi:MAG TPA: c-type cytochrome domain-containing protein, partial [Verrucomicrobiae bacterium]|nr:c-type cytochrome domain-containing protein [Verrucomicrobiae bacterium]
MFGVSAYAAEPTAEQVEFFEKRIRPIFAEHCYSCHSDKAEKVKGGLRLDTREALLKGGSSGAVIVPGDPDASPLIKAVRYQDAALQMPPAKGG